MLPNLVKLDNAAVTPEERIACAKLQVSDREIQAQNVAVSQAYTSS